MRASEDQAGEIPLGGGVGGAKQEPRETELLGSVQGQWGVEIWSVPQRKMAIGFFQAGVMGETWGKGVSNWLDHCVDWGGRKVKVGRSVHWEKKDDLR